VSNAIINYSILFFFYRARRHRALHSFPTRRSSDLRQFDRQIQSLEKKAEATRSEELKKEYRKNQRQYKADLEKLEADAGVDYQRSEEHTSELQSRGHLVCRLLLEKKKKKKKHKITR